MAHKQKFTYEGGRQIYVNGEPLISIGREGDTVPYIADEFSKLIVKMLNKSRSAQMLLQGDKWKWPRAR